MIHHVVMWELHDAAQAGAFCAALQRCAQLVPGQAAYITGCRSHAGDGNVDVCLVASFDDPASLQAYLAHPVHQDVSRSLAPWRRSRHVLDFPAPHAAPPADFR